MLKTSKTLKPGYNCKRCLEPLIIAEKEDWSESEWSVIRTLFGYVDEPNVTRIVAHVTKVECWNDVIDSNAENKSDNVTWRDIYESFKIVYPEWVSDVDDWRPYAEPYVHDDFKSMNIILWMINGDKKRYDYNTKKLYPVREE